MVHSVMTLLDDAHRKRVEGLWAELAAEVGVRGIEVTPHPHLSWHVSRAYDWDALRSILEDVASETEPFVIHTAGLGMFSGERPVIYVAVVPSQALLDFHRAVWQRVDPAATGSSDHYLPDRWMPHITLAQADVTPENVGEAMRRLAFRSFSWRIPVDHLAVIRQPQGEVGRLGERFPFLQRPGPE